MMVCILASCSNGGGEEPITPTPKPEEVKTEITIDSSIISNGLSFSSGEGEQSVSFSVNADWKLSIASTTSGITWCKASVTSGSKGTANIKFTVSENKDYEDRSVSVTIKAGAVSKTFTITQKGTDALLVTTTKYEIAQEGGQIEIEVKANIDYKMEISEEAKEWIKESSSRALTTYKHKLDIAMNEDAEKREGEITFKSGDKIEIVKVYQAGGSILLLSQNEYNVTDKGDTISVDIKSNIDFDVLMPEVDWIIDEASSRGLSSHTLKYIVSANEGYDSRSANIVFFDKNSDLKDTLKVFQTQKDAILVAKNEYSINAAGGDLKFEINTNVDFKVSASVDWIKQNTKSRGLEAKPLSFIIAENTADEVREGLITISSEEIKQEIKVVQKAKPVFTLSKTEFNITSEGDEFKVEVSTNGEYTITMPKVDWLKENESRATSTYTHTFTVSANETYDTRDAEIAFTHNETNEVVKVTVVQAQKDAIVISKKEYDVKAEGDTIEVTLSTNVDYEVQIPSDVAWISQTASRALKENSVYLIVKKNTSDEARNAKIIFFNETSQICENITINQAGTYKGSYVDGVATIAVAGSLKEILGNDYLEITSLKIVGLINGSDIKTVREMAGRNNVDQITNGNLLSLDISEATIVKGGANYLRDICTVDNEISSCMFYGTNLEKVIIPINCIKIGVNAFTYCKKLKEITLSENLTSIGSDAFSICENLTEINLPKSVTIIGGGAFWKCTSLEKINIPRNVTKIGIEAFKDCNKLSEIYIDDLLAWCNIDFVSYINNNIFLCYSNPANSANGRLYLNGKPLTELKIPAEVSEIKPFSFFKCSGITSVEIPNHVTSIGDYAFYGCKDIESLIIGDGITTIKEGHFYGCGKVKKLSIGKGITEIHTSFLSNYDKLTILILGENVTKIENVFYSAPLEEVHICAKNPPTLSNYTFNRDKMNATLYVPKGCKQLYVDSKWKLYFKSIMEE